eukprot:COSAG06_NODE_3594_length_5143_cov_2.285686_6_plen_26_part_01
MRSKKAHFVPVFEEIMMLLGPLLCV